jgi:hypothetical protein
MESWTAARSTVLADLLVLEHSIRAMEDPLSDRAIILLRAISSNLTARPETPQQINELKNYLQNDEIIDDAETPNGFGIEIDIRRPLMSALIELEQSVPA